MNSLAENCGSPGPSIPVSHIGKYSKYFVSKLSMRLLSQNAPLLGNLSTRHRQPSSVHRHVVTDLHLIWPRDIRKQCGETWAPLAVGRRTSCAFQIFKWKWCVSIHSWLIQHFRALDMSLPCPWWPWRFRNIPFRMAQGITALLPFSSTPFTSESSTVNEFSSSSTGLDDWRMEIQVVGQNRWQSPPVDVIGCIGLRLPTVSPPHAL